MPNPNHDPSAQNQPPIEPGLIEVPQFDANHMNQAQAPVYEYPNRDTVPPIAPNDNDESWGYTKQAGEAFGREYGGRSMIKRDSRIEGGVYYGTYGGEAIVVDSEKRPQKYTELLGQVTEGSRNKQGAIDRSQVLEATFNAVSKNMKYSQEGVDKLLKEVAQANGGQEFKDGTKINLSEFLEDGVGVCRHQALATAWVLEKMKDQGYIRGQVSVDRNMTWSPKGELEGHAWVRYTSNSGKVMILDVAQGYFGTLEESEGRKHGWDYMRPEEKQARISRDVGRNAMPPSVMQQA